MALQYIGARYVPKFYSGSNGTQWDQGVAYEAFTIVTYLNNSYTSKVPVPVGVGAPNLNPEYWAQTGNYNAQLEHYTQIVDALSANVNTLQGSVNQVQKDTANVAPWSVKYYGAVGDGVTDDTAAIKAAVANGYVVFEKGKTYAVSSEILLPNNTQIDGNGATIKCTQRFSTVPSAILKGDGVSNIIIDNLTIDMNQPNLPLITTQDDEYNMGIGLYGVENACITNCHLINLYTRGIMLYAVTGTIKIENCLFESGKQQQAIICEHIRLQTIGEKATIKVANNSIWNVKPDSSNYGVNGIMAANCHADTLISGNYLLYCGRNNAGTHRLAPIDLYIDCKNFTISNNVVLSTHMFLRLECAAHISVINNVFTSDATEDSNMEPWIWIYNSDSATLNTEDITLENNSFDNTGGTKVGAMLLMQCVREAQPIKDVRFINNIFKQGSNGMTIDTDGRVINWLVDGNNIVVKAGYGINISHKVSNSAVDVGDIKIVNNMISGNGFPIVIQAKTPGDQINLRGIKVHGNTLENTLNQFTFESAYECDIDGNTFIGGGLNLIGTPTDYSMVVNNRFGTEVTTPITGTSYVQANNIKGTSFIN